MQITTTNKIVRYYRAHQSRSMMNISLALGAGGAKGNSHIGVLRRLELHGFRIRAIAGTSFGGLVAIFYAFGFSPSEIEDMFSKVDQTNLYAHGPNRRSSLLGLLGASSWFESIFGDKTFADLKIPCAVTAVDLKSGNEVILTEGCLVDAILATIAIPGIFPPRHVNGWELVDGGVLDPVPVSVARSLAPDLPVVAVSLNEPLGRPARTWTIPLPKNLPRVVIEVLTRLTYAQAADVYMRSQDIVDRALSEYRLAMDNPEVIIRPKVQHIEMLDVVDVHEVAKLGEEATEAALPELRSKLKWHRRLGRRLFGGKRNEPRFSQY